MKVPEGNDVYHWPEFKAFAARLGIAWDMATTDLVIEMSLEKCVRITHTYRGTDTSDWEETTTMHNKEYRTFRVPPKPSADEPDARV